MTMPASAQEKTGVRSNDDEALPPAVGEAGLHRDVLSASVDFDFPAHNPSSTSGMSTPVESSLTSAGYTRTTEQAGENAATLHAEGPAEEIAATDDVDALVESKRAGRDGQTPERSSPGAKATSLTAPSSKLLSDTPQPESRSLLSSPTQSDTEQSRTSTLQGSDATGQNLEVTTPSSSASEGSLAGKSSATTAMRLSTVPGSEKHAAAHVSKAPVLDDSDSSDTEEMSLEQQRSFYSDWTT
jgi:hypothetical protein